MARFLQVGSRVINLDLVCGAERQSRGRLIVYLATAGGSGPAQWAFDDPDEVESLWSHLTGQRADAGDLSSTTLGLDESIVSSFKLSPIAHGH